MFRQAELFLNSPPPKHLKEDEQIARLRLLRTYTTSNKSYGGIMGIYQSATAALGALPDTACEPINNMSVDNTLEQSAPQHVQKELEQARRSGANLIEVDTLPDHCALKHDENAPPMLWGLGQTNLLQRSMVTLIGAEKPSSLAIRMTKKLSHSLSEAGITLLSDLKEGIAQIAATETMDKGVVFVSANGVDVASKHKYLTAHRSLLQNGLVVSEVPMGQTANERHLQARDYILTSLSQAIIVVECALKSPAFLFAQKALDQGANVLVIPGHPIDARASGCNALIRDGATLIRSLDDILEVLGDIAPVEDSNENDLSLYTSIPKAPPLAPEKHAALHEAILTRLSKKPMIEDKLIQALEVSAQNLAPIITELELDGKILRRPGGFLHSIKNP